MIKEEHLQALTDIGLGFVQAKTYLSMIRLGEVDAKAISKASGVARQDVYRILPTLEKLGLAERIIANPTIFKATPIKQGISILLRERNRKNEEVNKEANLLIRDFDAISNDSRDDEWQFKITSEKSLLMKMHLQMISKAQRTIDTIMPIQILEEKTKHNLYLRKAMSRGVKIRVISQKVEGRPIIRDLGIFKEATSFEVRYSINPNIVDNRWFGMHVFDRKEMTLCVSKNDGVPSLWSNGEPLLKLAISYFEDLWNCASGGQISRQPLLSAC